MAAVFRIRGLTADNRRSSRRGARWAMPRRILQLAEGAAQTVKRIPEGDLGTVVVGFTAALPEGIRWPRWGGI